MGICVHQDDQRLLMVTIHIIIMFMLFVGTGACYRFHTCATSHQTPNKKNLLRIYQLKIIRIREKRLTKAFF